MRRAVGCGLLVLALAVVFGVGSASGHTAAVTTITVEVIGKGKVTSTPDGIKCGDGSGTCYVAFGALGGSVDLKATPSSGWNFDSWGATYDTDPCGPGNHCTIPLDGANHVVTANFAGPSTGTSTLAVNYTGKGIVQGGQILCGNDDTAGPYTSCTWSVLTGSTLTVHETPDTVDDNGWVFGGWAGACDDTDDACTIKMDKNQNLSATWVESTDFEPLIVTISGNGRVEGGGITCHGPATCSENEPVGQNVTLTADPDSGYVFTGWTGDCAGAGPQCTVSMDDPLDTRTVTATFTLATTLTVKVVGNGNVSGGSGAINCGNGGIVCSADFAQNATVTLIATPSTGATFVGWTGACGGTSTTCTVLLSESRNVTATFSGGTAGGGGFLLTVSVAGSGTVTGPGINCGNGATLCSTTPAANATVTLIATPSTGATFAGWAGGSCTGTIPTCTVTMTVARSVTATFTTGGGGTTSVQLSVSVSGSGTVSGGGISCGNGATVCSVSLPTGSAITLTAIPAAGASFNGWAGACSGSSSTCTVTLTSSLSASASFSAAPAGTLTITVKGRGTVSAPAGRCIGTAVGGAKTCIQKYTKGRKLVLTATPAGGNTFAGWSDSCAARGKTRTCPLTLSTAKAVTATFLAGTTGGGGGGTTGPVLRSLGPPIVRHTAAGFRVTLRFNTSRAGIARVVGLRAGRVGARVTFRVAAGPARVGPFTVRLPGLYTFQVRVGTALLQWRVCLGRCGAAATAAPFVLVRRSPTVTRSGDVWSVTLHVRSTQPALARVRAVRTGRVLVNQRFLMRAGEISIGPFLLGPGNYTLRLTAMDAYGRTRTLSWVVALAP